MVGASEVAGSHHDGGPVAPQLESQLGCGGRFAGALKAGEQDHAGRAIRSLDFRRFSAQDAGEFFPDDLHDGLAGRKRGEDIPVDSSFSDVVDEGTGDLEIDVRFEECQADLAKGLVDVLFAELPPAGELREDSAEAFSE